MTYVIDGYNVIHALPALEKCLESSLKCARDALIRMCLVIRSSRGDVRRIVIVFDGDSAFRDFPAENCGDVEIVFTESSEEADERIVDVLRELRPSGRVCVVSADHFVRNNARAFGAERVHPRDFEALSRARGRAFEGPAAEESLTEAAARKLTEDYKKLLGLE
ncbi:MAG: NYN domain-containing protein [Candidatus Omnitrophica bacterium]|nr:NYN domain-containing protein [Candidatus Omnitrophota bacterium]